MKFKLKRIITREEASIKITNLKALLNFIKEQGQEVIITPPTLDEDVYSLEIYDEWRE